jgi:protein-disulfide isomerase
VLVQQEATRRNLTIDQMLQSAERSVPAPTAADIKEVYEKSAAAQQGLTLAQASPVIEAYLRQQKAVEARRLLVEQLRASASVDIKTRFDPPRQPVPTSSADPSIGTDAAPVKIVEFSDFECPYCRQTVPVLKQIASKFKDRVVIIWKDYPLSSHPFARSAAEAAHCVHEQGKFWPYHDVLFAHQEALTSSDLRRYALELDLDPLAFDRCIASGRFRDQVQASMQEARRLGVTATPTVFINGRMVTGAVPFESYDKIVLEELAAPRNGQCEGGVCSNPPTRKE